MDLQVLTNRFITHRTPFSWQDISHETIEEKKCAEHTKAAIAEVIERHKLKLKRIEMIRQRVEKQNDNKDLQTSEPSTMAEATA